VGVLRLRFGVVWEQCRLLVLHDQSGEQGGWRAARVRARWSGGKRAGATGGACFIRARHSGDIIKALVDSNHTRNNGSGHFQIEFILPFLGFKSPLDCFFISALEWASGVVHGVTQSSNGAGSWCDVGHGAERRWRAQHDRLGRRKNRGARANVGQVG
jgi:hypothetical protein